MPFAEVAVNTAIPLRQTFTYRIPDSLAVEAGSAVYVPFGRQTLQGIVIHVSEKPSFPDSRDIEALIERHPLLLAYQTALACWLSDYYMAPLFDCLSLLLPPGFKRKPLLFLKSLVEAEDLPNLGLSSLEREALVEVVKRRRVDFKTLAKTLGRNGLHATIRALNRRGLVECSYELERPRVAPKLLPHLRLLMSSTEALALSADLMARGSLRSVRQAATLAALAEESPLPLPQLRARTRLTGPQMEDMISRGWIAREKISVLRNPLAGRTYSERTAECLTVFQEQAAQAINEALEQSMIGKPRSPFLLHGVTGSGKTEVYLEALRKVIAKGKRAIILVPEISLTPQIVRRFSEHFPSQVAVMHSGLTLGEHFDIWREVKRGKYAVVVGSRRAIFAPQPDLGLVVVDEEHEWTFKQQDTSPRYDARRVAERLCQLTGAVLVFGSATPDVGSYWRAMEGQVQLLELPERLRSGTKGEQNVVTLPLPKVEIIDLRSELRAGNRSIFSSALTSALDATLEARQQAILFLNRRGTAAFVLCRECGHVPLCPRCSVAFAYHSAEQRLSCHHCNRRRRLTRGCPKCCSQRIATVGIGTERVEQEIRQAFPGVRTLRWDRDAAWSHSAHEEIHNQLLAHEVDVLIGTQIVAKGLDLPLVTLVGVISADITLHLPEFRSGERTFQLLEQVAGRAGRGSSEGKVIIQTYSPDNYAIRAASRHDYLSFCNEELRFRSRFHYPPFSDLIRMTFLHTSPTYAEEEALRVSLLLHSELDRRGLHNLALVGPAPTYIPKLRNRYRWQLLLRGSEAKDLLRPLTFPVGWTIDVDPGTLL